MQSDGCKFSAYSLEVNTSAFALFTFHLITSEVSEYEPRGKPGSLYADLAHLKIRNSRHPLPALNLGGIRQFDFDRDAVSQSVNEPAGR